MRTRTLLGLTVASVMPLLGPRPYFVKTAFAAETATITVNEVISIHNVECKLIADPRCDGSLDEFDGPNGAL